MSGVKQRVPVSHSYVPISGDLCDQVWSSSAVVARMAARTLITKSGTIYKLKGWLHEDEELHEGFSKKLIAIFKRGFPVNWVKAMKEDLLRFEYGGVMIDGVTNDPIAVHYRHTQW